MVLAMGPRVNRAAVVQSPAMARGTEVGEKGASPLGSKSVTGVIAAVREGRGSEVILAYAERRSPTAATFLSVAREVMLAIRANLKGWEE